MQCKRLLSINKQKQQRSEAGCLLHSDMNRVVNQILIMIAEQSSNRFLSGSEQSKLQTR